MRIMDLSIVIHQEARPVAMQDAGTAVCKRRRVQAALQAEASRFDAVHRDVGIIEKRMEQADRVRATANTGDQGVRKATFRLQHLLLCLPSYDALKIADHDRI